MSEPFCLPSLDVTREALRGERGEAVMAIADRLLGVEPPKVTAKTADALRWFEDASAITAHDYVSIQTYWWPNADSADGLPYEHRDGRLSPEVSRYDRPRWDLHGDAVRAFVLATIASGEARYAEAARRWVGVWCLDDATRMNPHLRHAQFLPGVNEGTLVGCIDFNTRALSYVETIDLACAAMPTVCDEAWRGGVDAWWSAMLDWLTSDAVRGWHDGRDNNLLVFYTLVVAGLADRFGRAEVVADRLDRVMRIVADQVEPDGRLPHELRRTRSFGYTTMTILGLTLLARLGARHGRSLLDADAGSGRSIRGAFEYVWGLAAGREAWPHPQIEAVEWTRLLATWLALPEDVRGRYPLDAVAHRVPAEVVKVPASVLCIPRLHPFFESAVAGHASPAAGS
ncbi:MAG: alginate lyase family protein [Planctomycetota bacterium]